MRPNEYSILESFSFLQVALLCWILSEVVESDWAFWVWFTLGIISFVWSLLPDPKEKR